MQKEIYLLRHGQTDYNLNGIVQGRGINSTLNSTGVNQATAFHQKYKHIPFDIVYTSALQRTYQTVEAFIKSGIEHTSMTALDEIDWGIYEGIAHDPQMHERYLDIINKWRQGDLHLNIDGGESAEDLSLRLSVFVEKMRKTNHRKVLACTHGRSLRALLCSMTGKPLSEMDDFPHLNTCLYKVIFENNKFEIEIFNNTDHLNI